MPTGAQSIYQPINDLEAWMKADGGFYDITRMPPFEDYPGTWEVSVFPKEGGQGVWCKGTAKTLKTAVKYALVAYDKWKAKTDAKV